jgi:alginate O-acetyltransferase complex protein AlgI
MLFNSGTFLWFFAAFLLAYYAVRNHLAGRNVLIVAGSYFFYGWWDYRFLLLLLFSSLLDYGVGLGLEKTGIPRRRKWLVSLSIAGNLGVLGLFKYYDFFVESFAALLSGIGMAPGLQTLGVVLPVGISFYTFQTMSYTLDVYRGRMRATRSLVEFLAFVSFFPQLVAGPIERAKHLLPQFGEPRWISRAMIEEGLWLCLWGLFKKVVLADNLAPLVEMVFEHSEAGGPMVVLATFAFGVQIYCDFSGYSDIARGAARLLGFDIMFNFNLPYAATDLRDFWRRWHISLSTWLRDYLYVSLGGNRRGAGRTYANLFITLFLGGLWHGAAWNFAAWGGWHGFGLAIHRLWTRRDFRLAEVPLGDPAVAAGQLPGPRPPRSGPGWRRLAAWLGTMLFVFYGWLLFRAGSWQQIVVLTSALGDFSLPTWTKSYCLNLALFTLPVIAMQAWQYRANNLLAPLRCSRWIRTGLESGFLLAIVLFWGKEKAPFIYFQF